MKNKIVKPIEPKLECMTLDKWEALQEELKMWSYDLDTWQDDIVCSVPTEYEVILEHKQKDVWILQENRYKYDEEEEWYLEILVDIDTENECVSIYEAYLKQVRK